MGNRPDPKLTSRLKGTGFEAVPNPPKEARAQVGVRGESPNWPEGEERAQSSLSKEEEPPEGESLSHTISSPREETRSPRVNNVQIWRFWFEMEKAALQS